MPATVEGTDITSLLERAGKSVDRSSAVPLHFQLSEELERLILTGTWKPGDQLPPEPQLCDLLGLSRTTVRQALHRIEQEGLIVRQKGRGTFVADDRRRAWLVQSAEGFFQDEVERHGREVSSTLLTLEEGELPSWACADLELEDGSPGVSIERLRSVDGRVALYVINCLPARFAPAIVGDVEGSPDVSLYERLRMAYGVEVVGGRRIMESVAANDRLAALLGVEPGSPLTFIRSVSWDRSMTPFDCYQAWVRTDRLKVEIEVVASSSPATAGGAAVA